MVDLEIQALFKKYSDSELPNIKAWIKNEKMSLYIRFGKRYFDDRFVETIQIASITFKERSGGRFTNLLEEFEEYFKDKVEYIMVESVMESRLKHFLFKKGYLSVDNNDFYKALK